MFLPNFQNTARRMNAAPMIFTGRAGRSFVSDQTVGQSGKPCLCCGRRRATITHNADFNGERQEGFGLVSGSPSIRANAGRRRAPMSSQSATRAISRWRTDTLVRDGSNHRSRSGVTGVQVRRGGRSETPPPNKDQRRGVVLSAGAFQFPQILMLSGIGPADHIRAHGIEVVFNRARESAATCRIISTTVSGWETTSDVPYRQHAQGLVKDGRCYGRTPAQTQRSDDHALCRSWRVLERHARFACARRTSGISCPPLLEDHGREKVKAHGFSLTMPACCGRKAGGRWRLGAPDAAAAPVIDPNFLADERDMAVLRAGVRLSHRIADAPALQAFGPRDRHPVDLDDDDALDAMIRKSRRHGLSPPSAPVAWGAMRMRWSIRR